jgi:hypothetical protein
LLPSPSPSPRTLNRRRRRGTVMERTVEEANGMST